MGKMGGKKTVEKKTIRRDGAIYARWGWTRWREHLLRLAVGLEVNRGTVDVEKLFAFH